MPWPTRDELDGPPIALQAAMAKHLQLSADVRIDTALLDKLLDSSGQSERFTAQLQGLQRQGYVTLEGKALTTHLSFEAGQFVERARALNPALVIVARAHSDVEVEYLQKLGADETIMGERETGNAMVSRAVARGV